MQSLSRKHPHIAKYHPQLMPGPQKVVWKDHQEVSSTKKANETNQKVGNASIMLSLSWLMECWYPIAEHGGMLQIEVGSANLLLALLLPSALPCNTTAG